MLIFNKRALQANIHKAYRHAHFSRVITSNYTVLQANSLLISVAF